MPEESIKAIIALNSLGFVSLVFFAGKLVQRVTTLESVFELLSEKVDDIRTLPVKLESTHEKLDMVYEELTKLRDRIRN